MLTSGLVLLVLVGLLFFGRWPRRYRSKPPNGVTPEEREMHFDTLRRKRSAEIKERKDEPKP
jgi:hypothetical protein